MTITKNKFWPFSFYFLFFAANAAYMPYKVLYFQGLDFNGPQIGFLTGISPIIIMTTIPIWTRTADKTNQYRLIMSVCLIGIVASLIAFPFLQTFPSILMITLLSTVFIAPIMSLLTSATMFMLGEEKNLFGRVRMGGSFGFGTSSLIVGFLVNAYDLKMAFWMGAVFSFIAFLVSLHLVYGQATDEEPVDEEGGIRDLLVNPNWILFLIVAFISGVALAASDSYFFPYMQELGIDESIMGLTLTMGSIATIPVLFLANHFINRFRAYGTMILSVVFTGLRLILFSLTGNMFAVIIIQMLNGLTGPLFGVAGVGYAYQNSPKHLRATGQGLFNVAAKGLGTAVGGFISGILLVRIGGQAMYFAIGLSTLVVLAVVVFLRSRFTAQTK